MNDKIVNDKRLDWILIAIEDGIEDGVYLDHEKCAKFNEKVNPSVFDIKTEYIKLKKANKKLQKENTELKNCTKSTPYIYIKEYIIGMFNGKQQGKRSKNSKKR